MCPAMQKYRPFIGDGKKLMVDLQWEGGGWNIWSGTDLYWAASWVSPILAECKIRGLILSFGFTEFNER